MGYWQKFRTVLTAPFHESPKWTDIAIVFLTLGLVLVGYWQYKDMEAAGAQTDKLIQAANIQACAATKNAEAATSFAESTSELKEQVKTAVHDSEQAAIQSSAVSKTAARNAERSIQATQDAMRLDQRAWVDGTVTETPQGFVIRFRNTGKTPAIKVSPPQYVFAADKDAPIPIEDMRRNVVPSTLPPNVKEEVEKELRKHEGYVLAPLSFHDFTLPISLGSSRSAQPVPGQGHRKPNFIQGYITYIDVFKQVHETWFCYEQMWQGGEVQLCDSQNGMN